MGRLNVGRPIVILHRSLVILNEPTPCHPEQNRPFVILNGAVRRSEGSEAPAWPWYGFLYQILRYRSE